MFKTPHRVAIDKHKIPRYDKKIGPHLIRSKPENGTKTFETYIAKSVEEMQRAQISWYSPALFVGGMYFLRDMASPYLWTENLARFCQLLSFVLIGRVIATPTIGGTPCE